MDSVHLQRVHELTALGISFFKCLTSSLPKVVWSSEEVPSPDVSSLNEFVRNLAEVEPSRVLRRVQILNVLGFAPTGHADLNTLVVVGCPALVIVPNHHQVHIRVCICS